MLYSFRYIIALGASALAWTSALARPGVNHEVVKRELGYYEERFVNTLNYKLPNETVKLIGCKKMKVPPSQLEEFEEHYYHPPHYTEYQKFEAHFYDEASMELRLYFPVADALIEHQGTVIEANELGEFDIENVDGDYAVLGRYQTDHVHGVDGNIITDGVIYLADKVYPHRQIGNIYVYDFGYKGLHDHDHLKRDSNPDAPNNGCVKNHGGINCSDKYKIHEGRCPEVHSTCMDYNGWFTDCNKAHRREYFIGSDCSVSVARGNCWNELEAAE